MNKFIDCSFEQKYKFFTVIAERHKIKHSNNKEFNKDKYDYNIIEVKQCQGRSVFGWMTVTVNRVPL
jgi:hypothetical protein